MTNPSSAPAILSQARIPPEAVEVVRTLQGAGYSAYFVGGSIRDVLLGKPAKDWDVATNARAEQVLQLFRRVVPTGLKHGTVTVVSRKLHVEVTTFRGEGAYADGRHPDQVFFLDRIEDDLARRDFTVNAMAFDPLAGSFVDPFGGQRDLAARLIRCVGEPAARFGEDGLRTLRAVRFAAVLEFDIDPATEAAIGQRLEVFAKVSAERVRDELSKLLAARQAGRGLLLLARTGLLERALPEVAALQSISGALERTARRVDFSPAALDSRLAALLHDLSPEAVASSLERLRLPNKTVERIALLVDLRGFGLAPYPDDASLRRALARAGRANVEALLALASAQAQSLGDGSLLASVAQVGARARAILAQNPPLSAGELALNGGQIMKALNAPPGPIVGQALRFLLEQVLADPSANQPERLAALLAQWKPEHS